ncbi:Psf2-domain-containing protein [Phellopilus nigrolimitatus]|nr:Psf2-domain-containing protein [Phellopilus nigrolimitatus]
MALPLALRNSMLPTELEFIASEELVSIRPTVKMEKIRFISGLYGPFVGGRLTKVPLWIAVNLKLKKKCNIDPPEWLNVEVLQDKLAVETELKSDQFVKLPMHFAEMAKVLLDVASDDLDQPDKIRTLLKDLRETRQSKIRDKLVHLNHRSLSMQGVCAMEINEVRPFFSQAMGAMIQLNVADPGLMDEPENAEEYS